MNLCLNDLYVLQENAVNFEIVLFENLYKVWYR